MEEHNTNYEELKTRAKYINNIGELIKDHWFFNDIIDPYFQSYERSKKLVADATYEVKKELGKGITYNTPWLYYSIYIMPLIWAAGLLNGGYGLFAIPALIAIIFPIMEICSKDEIINPDDEDYKRLQSDQRYMWALWLWPIVEIIIICGGGYVINSYNWTYWQIAGLALSTGLVNGAIGMSVAHELMHRTSNMERTLGQIILTMIMYPHFYIEHLLGHHKNVATSKDAGTSMRNESLYRFIPRAIYTSYTNAWALATKHNRAHIMYLYHFFVAMFIWFMFSISGICGVVYTIIQSIVAILFLETVNYIEHYGLVRNDTERVSLLHSWNTDKISTNYLSFKLQRHSDHHRDPKRRYQNLRDFPDTPRLPTGYTGCMLLATIPPLWYKYMNPRLDKLGDLRKLIKQKEKENIALAKECMISFQMENEMKSKKID